MDPPRRAKRQWSGRGNSGLTQCPPAATHRTIPPSTIPAQSHRSGDNTAPLLRTCGPSGHPAEPVGPWWACAITSLAIVPQKFLGFRKKRAALSAQAPQTLAQRPVSDEVHKLITLGMR